MFTSIKSWVAQPFKEQQDLVQWALFTGLIVILVFGWTRVLKHVTEI
jgi:hypothetical protein